MKTTSTVIMALLICAILTNVKAAKAKTNQKPAVKTAKQTVSSTKPTTQNKVVKTEIPPKTCKTKPIDSPEKWDFFQFGVWFDIPSITKHSNVYGIKIGAPFCSGDGTVKGIETAVFCGATDNITGLQACILTSVSKQLNGVQFSIVNCAETVEGLQLGVVNIAKNKSFQIGILNYIEDGAIPWLPIVNFKF